MIRRVALVLAAAVVLFAAPHPTTAAEPFEINVIVSLTGPFAFIGSAEGQSVRTITEIVNKHGGLNGQQIKLNVYDDQSSPAVANQLGSAIIAKGAQFMLGPTYLASCLAIAPLIKGKGPVMYCFAPTLHPQPGDYAFSGGASSGDQAIAQMRFMYGKGWRRAALISTIDATGQDIENRYTAEFNSGKYPGMQLIDKEHFAGSDTSVAAQIAKIKALNPDVVLDGTVGTPTGTVLRAIKDAGLDNKPIMSSLGNVIHSQMDQYAAILPPEIYFVAPRFIARDVSAKGPVRDAQLAFYKAYAAQGVDPDVGNNQSWDPTLIVYDALRHLGNTASAKTIYDYIQGLHSYPATDGIYDFRDGSFRGVQLNSVVVCRWDAGKKTWLTVSHPGGAPL